MADEHCGQKPLDQPITVEELRVYLWEAICESLDTNGLLPCAPQRDGESGLVVDFQRRLPNACGMPNRFRITIEPVPAP